MAEEVLESGTDSLRTPTIAGDVDFDSDVGNDGHKLVDWPPAPGRNDPFESLYGNDAKI